MQTKLLLTLAAMGFVSACGSSSDSAAKYSADKPSGLLGVVAAAVAKTGSGMSSATSMMTDGLIHPLMTSSACTVHGEPVSMSDSSGSYPGTLAYCKMTTDTEDEESIQGVFTGVQDIACMVEHAGPTMDGAAHTLTLTFDNNCFTDAKLAQMGVAKGFTASASVTGSSPAAFNSHYDRGFDIVANVGGGHHYTFGTKVTGNVIEITFQDIDTDVANKTGSGAGYLDLDNGILRVESRMDRLTCSDGGSCGWARHARVYATLNMDGTTPKDPKEVEFAYSNLNSAASGGGNAHGYLVTASGNLETTGIKTRGWTTTGSGDSYANSFSHWVETDPATTNCFTKTSDTATTCGAGAAGMTTNTKFVMASGSGYTPATTWFTSNAGLTFTSVSADSDTP